MDLEQKVIAWAPSGPLYESDKPETRTHNNRLLTVITLYSNHGVKTKVFCEPEPAMEYYEYLRNKMDSEHLIQVWDTGYKIEEGHGRARITK